MKQCCWFGRVTDFRTEHESDDSCDEPRFTQVMIEGDAGRRACRVAVSPQVAEGMCLGMAVTVTTVSGTMRVSNVQGKSIGILVS